MFMRLLFLVPVHEIFVTCTKYNVDHFSLKPYMAMYIYISFNNVSR